MLMNKETIEMNKDNHKVKFKHKFVENTFDNLDKFNRNCDQFMIKYIKPIFYHRAYTLWWIYLFIFSLIYPNIRGMCFVGGTIVCFGWHACVYFDYYLFDKPYDLLYRSMPTYSKQTLRIFDIVNHIILYIISYFNLIEKLNLFDVFLAWFYFKIWSYVQSDCKSFYYHSKNCKIYNFQNDVIFICSHSSETILLIIQALVIYYNNY